jgi:hypothetical protein
MGNGKQVRVSFGPVSIADVYASEHQKPGTLTAEYHQTVVKVSEYKGTQVTNNLHHNIFDVSEFGFQSQIFENTEERVFFGIVPENFTLEMAQERLKLTVEQIGEKLRLQKILALVPQPHSGQEWALNTGKMTIQDLAEKQMIKDKVTGRPVLYKDRYLQYRLINLRVDGLEDQDLRDQQLGEGKTYAEMFGQTL